MTENNGTHNETSAALDALNSGGGEGNNAEFTYLKSGGSFTVKVPQLAMISRYVYGSFSKKIYSFVAEEESDKSSNGYPIKNLTPFDKAWKHFKDQSDDWQDEMAQEASHFRCPQKFTIGFYDLDTGEPIMVEFTKNQAKSIVGIITKYQARLSQFAFELTKTGTSRDTVVALSLIPMLDDLTEKQQTNFEKSPETFDMANFEGLHYVMSNDEQVETLNRVGFDVTKIGLELPKEDGKKEGAGTEEEEHDF